MCDGAVLYADVLRPESGAERVPAIMTIGPYQKDRLWIPPEDLEEKANPYLAWETANPMWWCPRGYALVRANGQVGASHFESAGRLRRDSRDFSNDGCTC